MMPTPNDRFHLPEEEVRVEKCYPYYYLWRRLLTGTMIKAKFPVCPLLFLVTKFPPFCLCLIFIRLQSFMSFIFCWSCVTYVLSLVRYEEALHVPWPALRGPHRCDTGLFSPCASCWSLVYGGRSRCDSAPDGRFLRIRVGEDLGQCGLSVEYVVNDNVEVRDFV